MYKQPLDVAASRQKKTAFNAVFFMQDVKPFYSFCDCMKLSKRASVKRNHWFCSLRKAEKSS